MGHQRACEDEDERQLEKKRPLSHDHLIPLGNAKISMSSGKRLTRRVNAPPTERQPLSNLIPQDAETGRLLYSPVGVKKLSLCQLATRFGSAAMKMS
jgi:hypothetical protein